MWHKISRYYPPWFDLIPLLLFSLTAVYIQDHYNQLPSSIPTHFGASGRPDAWSNKNLWSVYSTLIIGFITYLSMVIINIFLLIRPDDPQKVVNISQRDKDILGLERLEEIRSFTVKTLVFLNFIISAMIAFLAYAATNIALGLYQGLGPLMWVFFALIMFTSLYLTVKVISMSSTSHMRR